MSNLQADEVDSWVPPTHRSGWGPLAATIGFTILLVLVGVFVVHPWQSKKKAKAVATTTTSTVPPTTSDVGSTVPQTATTIGPISPSPTTSPPLVGQDGYLNGALPPDLQAAAFGVSTGYGTWRVSSQSRFSYYQPPPGSIDRTCAGSPAAQGGLSRTYVLQSGTGPQHGQAVISIREFFTPAQAESWLERHGTIGFEACYHKFVDAVIHRSLPGSALSDEAITTGATTPGGKAEHYKANLAFGGLSCIQHEDDYWGAQNVYTVSASFTTCGRAFTPAAMAATVSDTISLSKSLPSY